MKKTETLCQFCKHNSQDDFKLVYSVVVATDRSIYSIGMPKMLENLEKWLAPKWLHLSASQILLLRSDVVKEHLDGVFKGEVVRGWAFEAKSMCEKCFKVYDSHVPLR
jgi:hypothetical protein